MTRELLAEYVQEALRNLGESVPLEHLSRRPGSTRPPELGTILELLYATPQELRSADGELLGSARYIALWWDKEGGAPDLILCGTDDGNHLGAAFATNGLRSFEALMEGAPSSSPHSMVTAARLRPPGYDSSDDYQYPYGWELKTDKSAYVKGEPVMLTVRRQNKWDKRGAFKACNLDANRLRQFSDLPTSVRLDSFASPPVSSPVWRLGVRGTYPPA